MRELRERYRLPYRTIAAKFEVYVGNAFAVYNWKTWRHFRDMMQVWETIWTRWKAGF